MLMALRPATCTSAEAVLAGNGGVLRVSSRPAPDAWSSTATRPALAVLSDGRGPGSTRAYPPDCADFGSMPITMLAVQLRAFCAPASRTGTAGLRPGADGRRSGQSR